MKKRLIDANGSYTINANDNTGYSLCFVGGTISVFDDIGRCICEFDAEDAPTVDAIVLPCKIGAPVHRIYDDCDFPWDCGTKMLCKGCDYRNLFIEKQAFCLSMLSQNGKLEHPYYLTHKEAKKALAKMDGGNEDG